MKKIISLIALLLFSQSSLWAASFEEFVVRDAIKPNLLKQYGYTVYNKATDVRAINIGYRMTDISLEPTNPYNNGNLVLRIHNKTPRWFANLNVLVDGRGIHFPERLAPFSYIDIQLWNTDLLKEDSDLVFLDPNPQFRTNVSGFTSRNTDKTIAAYRLMQSHLKAFYADQTTRDQFYQYFFNSRRVAQRSEMLGKWHRTGTYDVPKGYDVYRTSSAGIASNKWLSINWPMARFLANYSYLYPYGTLSHEYAHTMSYNHSSGLAYGWDNYVRSGIGRLMTSGLIKAGENTEETADVYWHFDDSNSVLTPYSVDNSRFSVENTRLIVVDNIIQSAEKYGRGVKLNFENHAHYYKNNNKILINADIKDANAKHYRVGQLANYIIDDWFLPAANYNIKFGQWSRNYSADANNSSVYFLIPAQDAIQSGATVRRAGWYVRGAARFVANVTHAESGVAYGMAMLGEKRRGLVAGSGSAKGDGIVRFRIDPNNNEHLPSGLYTGQFNIEAKGWHSPAFHKDLVVDIRHEIKEEKSPDELDYALVGTNTDVFVTAESKQYNTQAYFFTESTEVGPTSKKWRPSASFSWLKVPVVDINGEQHTLNLRGIRARHWNKPAEMNSGQNYYSYRDSKFRLEYRKGDNPHLKKGRYISPEDSKLAIFARGYYGGAVQKMNFFIDIQTSGNDLDYNLVATEADTVVVSESKQYNTQAFFITDSNQVGPTSKKWRPASSYSRLNVPVVDTDGKHHTMNLRGIRVRHWNKPAEMNSGQNFYRYTDSKFRLEYRKSDNLHLKQGHYVSPSNYKLPIFARGYYGGPVQQMNFHIDVKTNGRN